MPLLAHFWQYGLQLCWGEEAGVFCMVFLSEVADGAKCSSSAPVKGEPWRIQPEAEGVGAPCAPFFRGPGRAGIQNVTWMGEPALPTGSRLSRTYLSYSDCLCLLVWLLTRIPTAGENLFSRRGLINACSCEWERAGGTETDCYLEVGRQKMEEFPRS